MRYICSRPSLLKSQQLLDGFVQFFVLKPSIITLNDIPISADGGATVFMFGCVFLIQSYYTLNLYLHRWNGFNHKNLELFQSQMCRYILLADQINLFWDAACNPSHVGHDCVVTDMVKHKLFGCFFNHLRLYIWLPNIIALSLLMQKASRFYFIPTENISELLTSARTHRVKGC